jgi:hypothetical protein
MQTRAQTRRSISASRRETDSLRGAPVWVGRYEGFYYRSTGKVIVDRDGERLHFNSFEEAEDRLDQMDMLGD